MTATGGSWMPNYKSWLHKRQCFKTLPSSYLGTICPFIRERRISTPKYLPLGLQGQSCFADPMGDKEITLPYRLRKRRETVCPLQFSHQGILCRPEIRLRMVSQVDLPLLVADSECHEVTALFQAHSLILIHIPDIESLVRPARRNRRKVPRSSRESSDYFYKEPCESQRLGNALRKRRNSFHARRRCNCP